jgi:hypothetical protein
MWEVRLLTLVVRCAAPYLGPVSTIEKIPISLIDQKKRPPGARPASMSEIAFHEKAGRSQVDS